MRLAAEAGFAGVEVWGTEVDTDDGLTLVQALAKAHGLTIAGVCPQDDLLRWHYDWDAELEILLRVRCAAYGRLGARYLILPVMSAEGSLETLARNLDRASRIAEAYGVRVALEPVGHVPKLDKVDVAFDVLAECEDSVHPGIILDSFHFFRGGNSLVVLEGRRLQQILAVHLADAAELPHRQLVGGRHRVYPGTGIFNVTGFCRQVHAMGFRGPYVVELFNEIYWREDPGLVAREAFRTASQVVRASSICP